MNFVHLLLPEKAGNRVTSSPRVKEQPDLECRDWGAEPDCVHWDTDYLEPEEVLE